MSATKAIDTETAEEFIAALSPDSKLWGGYPDLWIYRGQSKGDHGLVPSAQRRPWPIDYFPGAWTFDRDRNHDAHHGFALTEVGNLKKFLMSANEAGLLTAGGAEEYLQPTRHRQINDAIQNMGEDPGHWPPESLIPAVALAQHHGIPTRMLDWSLRAFVAAYFAVREVAKRSEGTAKCRTGIVSLFGVSVTSGSPRSTNESPCSTRRNGNRDSRSFKWHAQATQNLHAQHGVFVLDRGYFPEEKSLDDIVESTESSGMLMKITAPTRETPKILGLLHAHGVGAGALFPGYDGAAKQARELWYWDNPARPPEGD